MTVENKYFQALTDFYANAYGDPQYIERREQELGFRLPEAVREWYVRFGQTGIRDFIEHLPMKGASEIGYCDGPHSDNSPDGVRKSGSWLVVLDHGCGGWTASVPLNGEDDPPLIWEVPYTPTLMHYRFSAYMFDQVAFTGVGEGRVHSQSCALNAECASPTSGQLAELQEILNAGPVTLKREIDLAGNELRTENYLSSDASEANWRFFRNDSALWIRSGKSTKTGEEKTVWYFRARRLSTLESLVRDVWHIAPLADTLRVAYERSKQVDPCQELLLELRKQLH